MSYRTIRKTFIDYFTKHGHTHVPSSPVVPSFHDKSCLFVNAGMFQFKNLFLGQQHPDYPGLKRAVNSQKCVRISGKHNDLDVVGKDGNHHTFFEMLGNWSFGDYPAEKACHMALDLLVNHYKLPFEKLFFTYFGGGNNLQPDLTVRDIWISLGVPITQIVRGHLPMKDFVRPPMTDNFWAMGASGPCGTCTEIYYDINGVMHDREYFYVKHIDELEEIWNIVMINYNRQADSGNLVPLSQNHVDTGMGFERLVKVLEGKNSNYETSLFTPLTEYLENANGKKMKFLDCEDVDKQAFQTLLDHMRCLSVAITDGASFSSGGRGPALKQLMKRSIWFAERILQIERLDWEKIVNIMADTYSDSFPEIGANQECTIEELVGEDLKSRKSLYSAEEIFKKQISQKSFNLDRVRKLYETHGLPLEVARLLCREKGIKFSTHDIVKIQSYTAVQNPQFASTPSFIPDLIPVYPEFKSFMAKNGVESHSVLIRKDLSLEGVKILAIKQRERVVQSKAKDGFASIVLDKTCFFPAKAGSVSDSGTLVSDDYEFQIERVECLNDLLIHHGTFKCLSDTESVEGLSFRMQVDVERRLAIARAHTSVLVVAHNLAREYAIKNKELNIVDVEVGFDRAILRVMFDPSLKSGVYQGRSWAEVARTCSLYVDKSHAHKNESEPEGSLVPEEDIFFFDERVTPFHKLISYPSATYFAPNLNLSSRNLEKVSKSPHILSCAPFTSEVLSLSRLEIIDFKKSKDGHHKVYITSGPVAEDIYQSSEDVADGLGAIYEIPNTTEQGYALKELARGKILSFRFRFLLMAKKVHIASQAGSKYFGLFSPDKFK